MALSQIGNAAGEAAHDAGTTRQREPFVPVAVPVPTPVEPPPAGATAVARTLAARALVARPVAAPDGTAADALLDAIRRGLAPSDPVATLLARWPAPTVRPVAVTRPARQPEPA
jgi:hypothetical protein